MTEETRAEKSIADELSKLGKQVADAIRAAWESEDRKKLQAEITEGLQKFGAELNEVAQKATESEAARQLREQAAKVASEVKQGDVTEQVRKGLLSALETLNQELGRLVERLEAKKPAEAPAAPATGEAPEPAPAAEPTPEPPAAGGETSPTG